jgi:hypothetical protein
MTSRSWRIVLLNFPAALTIALIVVHQSIIASSVYFLSELIERFQSGGEYAGYLLLYISSMIIPFVPGCLSFVAMQHWVNRVHRRVTDLLTAGALGKVELYRSASQRETFESAISRNAFGVVGGYIALSHDFMSLLLNSVLSMAVIGFLLPAALLWGYVASFALSLVVIRLLVRPVQRRSEQLEALHAQYGTCLSRAWDNAVVGNRYNFDNWCKVREESGRNYYNNALRLTSIKQGGNLLIALVSLIPTAWLLYGFATEGTASAAVLAVVIVNLTRIFHILNSMSALIYQMLEWSSFNARLSYLLRVRDFDPHATELPTVPAAAITIGQAPVRDFDSAVREIARHDRGRFTVRGPNGAGKSTLLLAMKKAYSEAAFLLPTTGAFLCWSGDYRQHSTGQRMRLVLDEIYASAKGLRYLLLDEWDANLDVEHRQRLDKMLTELSRRFVVVEVRH